jgi:hypothetical protein
MSTKRPVEISFDEKSEQEPPVKKEKTSTGTAKKWRCLHRDDMKWACCECAWSVHNRFPACPSCGHQKCEDPGGDSNVHPKLVYDIEKRELCAALENLYGLTKLPPELNSIISQYSEHRHAWVYLQTRVVSVDTRRSIGYHTPAGMLLTIVGRHERTEDELLSEYRRWIYAATGVYYRECIESFFINLDVLAKNGCVERFLAPGM